MKAHLLALSLCLAGFAQAADNAPAPAATVPPASDKRGLTFEKDIKPMFEAACNKCHNAKKANGGLRLDTLEATLKGGDDGKFVIVGDGEKSDLVRSVARVKGIKAMPPKDKGDPMTPEQIGIIRAWIDQGAK